MKNLPVLEDPTRVEFGQYRTVCSCRDCTIFCEHMPGYLIPSDLARIARKIHPVDIRVWAVENLLASPGALVVKDGIPMRVPTLVPAKQANGWCRFLRAKDSGNTAHYCTIHEFAPFGCAFFDSHQDETVARRLSKEGVTEVARAHAEGSLYSRLWTALDLLGLQAEPPVVSLKRMREAYIIETKGRANGGNPHAAGPGGVDA